MITEIHVTGDELNALNKKVGGIHMPKQMTEQEYLQSCTTEQLAEFLTKVILDDKRFRMTMVGGVNETKLWLKQPHGGES